MRVFVFVLAAIVPLAGCLIDNDRVRVDSFAVNPDGTFTFDALSNTVMTENDDGAAEEIRRDWLAEALASRGLCGAGYLIETRQLVVPPEPAGNTRDIVYTGRCLQQ